MAAEIQIFILRRKILAWDERKKTCFHKEFFIIITSWSIIGEHEYVHIHHDVAKAFVLFFMLTDIV